jgi:THO complex subunit 4
VMGLWIITELDQDTGGYVWQLKFGVKFLRSSFRTDGSEMFCSGGTRGRGFGGRRGGGSSFRGRGRGRGAGRGRGRVPAEEKSAEDLDAELETYHAEAMQM